MSIVQTEWWCLELPQEWQAEMADDCVSISDCDEISFLDISAIKKQGASVAEEDLLDLSDDLLQQKIPYQSVTVASLRGISFVYDDRDEGVAWREWYLAQDDLLLYITYNTDLENKGLDDAVVDEILATLLVLPDTPDA